MTISKAKKNTTLTGHGVLFEGRPTIPRLAHQARGWGEYVSDGSGITYILDPDKPTVGKAVCRCGANSPVLETTAARQRWHREHKDEIRNQK